MAGVTSHDLYRLKSLTQPSTYGTKTFFVQNGMDEEQNQYTADIFSVDDHQNLRQYTDGGINIQPLVFQDQLYYLHQDDQGRFQLFKMPIDGGIAHQLTNGDSLSQMHLSTDQNNLVFKSIHTPTATKYTTSGRPQIRHITKLQSRQDGIGWLPNDFRYSLLLLDLKTGQILKLFEDRRDFNFQNISPSQTQMLYLSSTHPDWKTQVDTTQGVYLYDLDQKSATLITESVREGHFTDAEFSKDGKQIAIIGHDNRYSSATVNNLYIYDIAKKSLTNVTEKYDDIDVGYAGGLSTDFAQHRSNYGGHWLSTGDYLFHAYHHGYSQLYLWDGQKIKLISDRHREIYDFILQDTQHVILSSSTPTKPCELAQLDLTSGQEAPLYNPNAKYEQDHQYASVDAFNYPSDDGKVQLEGWIMHANSEKDQQPVILYVHGGPHDAYGESFFHEFQVLANHGFNVVYVNPRGSTTYGQAFEKDVQGHYGEHDYQDVIAGLNYALKHFEHLNADETFIVGGSYGGFMTTWAIGHTDRFKAAIAQRPLVDWQSMYGTSDIGISFSRAELGYDLFKDANAHQIYWEKSPLTYAANVKTPVRIQHGEYDMRCPVNQSEAYYTAVKETGTDCDYIRYPQSYHGMSRHGIPNLRVQRIEDIMEWLRRY